MRHFLNYFLLLGFFTFGGNPATASDDLAERIQAAVPAGYSGQVVVGTPSKVLYSGSFGMADRDLGIPVKNTTLFDMGSITKTFTATAILMLAADDRLLTDQRPGDYFSELPDQTAAITIHQLLTHTSGLPEYSGEDEDPRTASSFVDWLKVTELDFEPGDHYAYSNPGYSTLARIVEKVANTPYETFLHEELISPLKLGAIGYLDLPEDSNQAVGYLGDERKGHPQEMNWLASIASYCAPWC